MATVVSLTETKIQELLAGWEGVALSQDQINSLITQLGVDVGSQGASLEHFNEVVRPQLEQELGEGAIAVNDLLSTQIPQLQVDLQNAQDNLEVLNDHTIPALQEELTTTAINVVEAPKVYVQTEAPEDPDENERYLVVGDVWYDSDDNNLQRIWNGVEWTSFGVDIPDFSLTVKKFISSNHMIY